LVAWNAASAFRKERTSCCVAAVAAVVLAMAVAVAVAMRA
jgi:hypothetical protein